MVASCCEAIPTISWYETSGSSAGHAVGGFPEWQAALAHLGAITFAARSDQVRASAGTTGTLSPTAGGDVSQAASASASVQAPIRRPLVVMSLGPPRRHLAQDARRRPRVDVDAKGPGHVGVNF